MMLKAVTIRSAKVDSRAMHVQALDDNDLLVRIGRGRDQESFLELHRRYQKPAFALAYFITHDPGLAEDALQEAFLKVWLKASSYQQGSPRSWILRIVTRECFKRLRGDKRARRAGQSVDLAPGMEGEPASALPVPGESVERAELLCRLRKALHLIPEADQQVVALYFGVGLTQDEIACELAISQRAVSIHIQQITRRLRTLLPGLAALPPGEADVLVGEALCSGSQPLPGIVEGVLGRIAQADQGAAPSIFAAKGMAWALPAAGVMVVLLAAWGFLGLWAPSSSPAQPVLNAASPARMLRPAVYGHWDLRKGPPSDLQIRGGWWRWHNDGQNSGMEVMARNSVIQLPPALPPVPMILTLWLKSPILGTVKFGAAWSNGQHLLPNRLRYVGDRDEVNPRNEEAQVRFLICGRHMVMSWGDRAPCRVYEFNSEYPGSRIALVLGRMVLNQIELRALASEEIPEYLRDPNRLVEESARVQEYEEALLPELLPSPTPLLNRSWDFNERNAAGSRLPDQLYPKDSLECQHLPDGGLEGSGCLEIEAKKGLFSAVLDIPATRLPVLVSMKCSFQQPSRLEHMATWIRRKTRAQPPWLMNMGRRLDHGPGTWFEVRFYLTPECVSGWEGDQHVFLSLGAWDGFSVLNWRVAADKGARMRIDNLAIREIAAGEVPDLSPCLAAWKTLAPQASALPRKEMAVLSVPELGSAYPDRPVQLLIPPEDSAAAQPGQDAPRTPSSNDF